MDIISIIGAFGGIAGLISFIKFALTNKSYKKKTDEEADSVAIANLKEAINVLRETINNQKQEISDLQNKIKTLSVDFKKSIKYIFYLEENSKKLKSILEDNVSCSYILNNYNCPIIEKYKTTFQSINDKTSS